MTGAGWNSASCLASELVNEIAISRDNGRTRYAGIVNGEETRIRSRKTVVDCARSSTSVAFMREMPLVAPAVFIIRSASARSSRRRLIGAPQDAAASSDLEIRLADLFPSLNR